MIEIVCAARSSTYQQRKRERLQQYGQLLETNETELMNHVVTQLFSRIPEDVDSSIEFLNKMGYPIHEDKRVQIIFINVQSFRNSSEPIFSEKSIHKAISNALKQANMIYPVLKLSTVNRYRIFVLVLFSATEEELAITSEQYQAFYEMLCAELPNETLTCYAGNWVACKDMRERSSLYTSISTKTFQTRGASLSPDKTLLQLPQPTLPRVLSAGKR